MNQQERELQDIYYGQIMQGIYSRMSNEDVVYLRGEISNDTTYAFDNMSLIAMGQAQAMIRLRDKT